MTNERLNYQQHRAATAKHARPRMCQRMAAHMTCTDFYQQTVKMNQYRQQQRLLSLFPTHTESSILVQRILTLCLSDAREPLTGSQHMNSPVMSSVSRHVVTNLSSWKRCGRIGPLQYSHGTDKQDQTGK